MNAGATLLEGNRTEAHAARILVVEDERIVARSLRTELATLGYDVVGIAPSGEEAVEQAGRLRPDLVLMDISLEGAMDGVEAAAIIRKQFRLPVVYLTAYSNKEILERAKVTEPFGYILKPYENRELHVVVETALYKHRMERQQQEREQWFVATLKSIGDAVVATDNEGRVTYMNPQAERLTGWDSQDALGRPLHDVVRFIYKDAAESTGAPEDRATQEKTSIDDILLIAKDASATVIENCGTVIFDEYGDAQGKVVVFRDVTWRKRLEEAYRQARKLEAIGQLASGVAHSFNNLMTVVIGHSELMLDEMTPADPYFANAQEIMRSARRTAILTQKLLAFGRKQRLTMGSVDLNAVVICLQQTIQAMSENVRVDLALEPALGRTKADPEQLAEAILTLVRNAFESMPRGGQLRLQTANVELEQDHIHDRPEVRPGPYVLLAISDTGSGMRAEAISHLFEPFFTTKTNVGAGLGLAAVYGLVKQCGGDIAVQSAPGKGTTFRLYLPQTDDESAAEAAPHQ